MHGLQSWFGPGLRRDQVTDPDRSVVSEHGHVQRDLECAALPQADDPEPLRLFNQGRELPAVLRASPPAATNGGRVLGQADAPPLPLGAVKLDANMQAARAVGLADDQPAERRGLPPGNREVIVILIRFLLGVDLPQRRGQKMQPIVMVSASSLL